MALISCPECGKEVSDRASSCIHCGCPLAANNTPATPSVAEKVIPSKPKKKKKSKVVLLVSIISAVILIAAAVTVYLNFFSPQAKMLAEYNEAIHLFNEGQYVQALPRFEALGDYYESIDLAKRCQYMIATNFMAQEKWSSAVSMLETLTYNDSQELLKECQYNLGIEAMKAFDWETTKGYFTDLGYEQSEKMLTDCSFMLALEESVLRRMEINAKESSDNRSIVTTELAYLEEYRKAVFYDTSIGAQAKKYISGLDKQLSGLTYEHYYEYQRDWNTGLVARYEALNYLYKNYGFMSDNRDFIGEYINQLDYYQKWLKAFTDMETKGHIVVRDGVGTSTYIEYYLKNNTPHTSTQTFDVIFWADKFEGNQLLGQASATISDIGPYAEYTVRVYIPSAAKDAYYNGGYYCNWYNYYNEIKIK